VLNAFKKMPFCCHFISKSLGGSAKGTGHFLTLLADHMTLFSVGE
jgi:hypothetical protein